MKSGECGEKGCITLAIKPPSHAKASAVIRNSATLSSHMVQMSSEVATDRRNRVCSTTSSASSPPPSRIAIPGSHSARDSRVWRVSAIASLQTGLHSCAGVLTNTVMSVMSIQAVAHTTMPSENLATTREGAASVPPCAKGD